MASVGGSCNSAYLLGAPWRFVSSVKLFLTLRRLARTCKDKVSKLVRVKGLHLKNHTGDRVGTSMLRTYLGKRSDNQVIAVPGNTEKEAEPMNFKNDTQVTQKFIPVSNPPVPVTLLRGRTAGAMNSKEKQHPAHDCWLCGGSI